MKKKRILIYLLLVCACCLSACAKEQEQERIFEPYNQTAMYYARDNIYGESRCLAEDAAFSKYLNQTEFVGQDQDLYDGVALESEKQQLDDQEIASFFQGPKAYAASIDWSGDWAEYLINGNSFGAFGCGFCCMANLYYTLTPYKCGPLDMMELAMDVTSYYPTGRSGAIDWPQMKKTLNYVGFETELGHKPDSYQEFVQLIQESEGAIVLICSYEDDTFWQDTPGHYVNIWNYREQDDTVFLSEPGSLEANRTRIPLEYVYRALKTDSNYQYIRALKYTEEKNQWKRDKVTGYWNKPS